MPIFVYKNDIIEYTLSRNAKKNVNFRIKQNGEVCISAPRRVSKIELEKIVLDTIENDYKFPIIKSNNFGHIETKTVIPIGTKAKIDTNKDIKIELAEKCVISD